MKPSVCIDMLGRELPSFSDRMKLVKDCGFAAVEFWSWWDKDLSEIRSAKDAYGLDVAAFCTRFDDNPGDAVRRQGYLDSLEKSVEAAISLSCPTLISQPGPVLEGVSPELQRENLAETLCQAAVLLEGSGVTLALEPLNPIDHPGCFLVGSEDAFSLLAQVDSPQVKLLFDLYHQQVSEGNLTAHFTKHLDRIAHFHAAGTPGRHELTPSEMDYSYLLKVLVDSGYQGYVGLEYAPCLDTAESLRRMRSLFP